MPRSLSRNPIATRRQIRKLTAINPPPTNDPTLPATAADFDPDGALTRDYLLRRGRCCQEGCRNCPYGFVPPDKAASVGSAESL